MTKQDYMRLPKERLAELLEMQDVKIFASIIDDVTKQQVMEAATCDAYSGCTIRVMPDCHAGSGCTIGSVIRFDERVVPNTVGVDIGCGMLVTELGKVNINLAELDRVVTERIPSGFAIHEKPVVDTNLFDELNCKQVIDREYMLRSIGTLGGGNHFIELDEDEEGRKYLVIHSGSRNLGVKVCKYWQDKAVANLTDNSNVRNELIARLKAEGRQREIGEELKKLKKPTINENLAYIEGADLIAYLSDMRTCQNYAVMNRRVMANIICGALGISYEDRFTTIHNYIEIETKTIRKGAISAKRGEKVIIPMNMRDGSLICIGKGNEDWLCSAPHGAGRIMSRAQAFKSLDMGEFRRSMEGIYTTSVCEGTLDEAPMVYKSADIIRKDIEPTVDIVKVIKPLWNFKAKTPESERLIKSTSL